MSWKLVDNIKNNVHEKAEKYKEKKIAKAANIALEKERLKLLQQMEMDEYISNVVWNAKSIANEHNITISEALQVMNLISLEDISDKFNNLECKYDDLEYKISNLECEVLNKKIGR